jgi:hypothetical protein
MCMRKQLHLGSYLLAAPASTSMTRSCRLLAENSPRSICSWAGRCRSSPSIKADLAGAEYCIRAAQPLLELVDEDAAATAHRIDLNTFRNRDSQLECVQLRGAIRGTGSDDAQVTDVDE